MARIRTIKPDAFKSDSLSQVPRGVRWTFAGLWTYADDKGRGRDDVRLLKAELYPLDDEVTLAVIADDMKRLEHEECICRYEAGGKPYFHIVKWKHQRINRPGDSTIPPCPRHSDEPSGTDPGGLTEPSVNDHGGLTEDSRQERKGKEGKGRENTRASTRTKLPTPDDWAGPTDSHREQAAKLELKIDYELERFLDSWRARGAKYKDPDAAFRNWLRQSAKWGGSSYSPNTATSPVSRNHVPLEVPSHIDPDDAQAYAAWLREASQ